MRFRRIDTDSLKSFSYYISDDGVAIVIDPRTDVEIYLELAAIDNAEIKYVFETHRHEDMISGAKLLGELTGAKVNISGYEDLGHDYGNGISEEDIFEISDRLVLFPIHTPGHTLGHLSYLLKYDDEPYMVFTGDSLFYGGVGRTDFYGKDKLEYMTGLQYDSIMGKLGELGDDVIVLPGHGAGSACGNDLDGIPYSTIGFEMKHNKALFKQKSEFIENNGFVHYKNPAFTFMEKENIAGSGVYRVQLPPIISEIPKDALVLDIRSKQCSKTSIPGALIMPSDSIPSYLGYLVNSDQKLVLLNDDNEDGLKEAVNTLFRTGFHNVVGLLSSGTLYDYEVEGLELLNLERVSAHEYLEKCEEHEIYTLDVRKEEEYSEADKLKGRINIPLQELKNRIKELDGIGTVYVVCRSSLRASIAASYIAANTDTVPIVVEGGILALDSVR